MPTEKTITLQKLLKEEKAKEIHVVYLSPGTFVSETSSVECSSIDIKSAVEGAAKIKERHGATPYGFSFVDGNNKPLDDATYYITGEVISYDNVPKTAKNSTLRSNMRCNDFAYIVENNNSWKTTQPFREEDVVVGWDGKIQIRGNSPMLMKYRKTFTHAQKTH